MNPSEFIHPEDAAALRQLEAMPGFTAVMKKFMSVGYETMQYGLNMAKSIRLSETQLPELYRHLPPICNKLEIEEPEFYLQMDPHPNAWTFGDTRIYITVTSGLVEMMSEEELDAVLAHECGHILCRHVLYHNMANLLLNFSDALGIFGSLTAPVQYALWYWQRKSELSCDRVASLVTSPIVVAKVMARLAGGPKAITEKINMEEWAVQADKYDEIYNDGMWNKALQILATADQDHPFSAVRVREILKWEKSEQYELLKKTMNHENANDDELKCPSCKHIIKNDWTYCQYCGKLLK